MPVSINLGPEVATLPACDDPGEVGGMIYAIDKLREQHKLPPYSWSTAELVEFGVPQDVAEKVSAQELPDIYRKNCWISNWDEVPRVMTCTN